MPSKRCIGFLFSCAIISAASAIAEDPAHTLSEWSDWGATPGGTRYVNSDEITPENVEQLTVAWRYSTGELQRRSSEMLQNSSSETTPILAAGSIITCTPFGRVIALDPLTGAERWAFDPKIDATFELPNQYVCRGVSQWIDHEAPTESACAHRVVYATVDLRLIAIDAHTGAACDTFGDNGQVQLHEPNQQHNGELKLASPPTVTNDIIAVGSMILDNVRANAPRGVVYGFDARTGQPAWTFDPIPQDSGPTDSDWLEDSRHRTGAANMWSVMSSDEALDLLFIPTSSPAPDYYGGERPGDNRYGNSLVALKASTGEVVWSFQLVHHDVWDYDTPAQPTLVTIDKDGLAIPAVVQTTKHGFIFVFDRRTGEPLFPIEERPVPQNGVPGEQLSKTQPIPTLPEPLFDTDLTPDDAYGFTFWDRGACRDLIEKYRFDGLFTPASIEGSIHYPSAAGGANWGGAAIDPATQSLFVNSSRVASVITLIPDDGTAGDSVALSGGVDISPMKGTPYAAKREFLLSPWGAPCTPPPWGGLSAYDLKTGKKRWDVPLGSINHVVPVPLPFDWNLGTPNIGGPAATAGGVLFIAATMDQYLRAFDMKTGEELWKDKLPGGSQTTPMTYSVDGKQYVIIVTGQHLWFQTDASDTIVAYALPDGE